MPEYWQVVGDGTIGTVKQTTIGDDVEWLKESDGHDTVIDCTSYNEESKDLVMTLLRRGYWLHTCNKELVSKHWKELLDICNDTPEAKIFFNSIPASKTMEKFMGVDITNDNFEKYKDLDLYSYKEADADITAEYIVRDIARELKRRKLGIENINLDGKFSNYTAKYLKKLLGGQFLSGNSAPHSPADPINKYNFNSDGYRSREFGLDNRILAAGCSFTFGSGVPEDAIWANVVGDKLDIPNAVLASPGASTSFIIEELFAYFKAYGNPEVVLCLFPNHERLEVPCDGELISSPPGHVDPLVDTVDAANYSVLSRKYIKRPYNVEHITTEEMGLYRAIKNIRMLEQYCASTKINLIWGTWNVKFNEILLELNGTNEFNFNNYFDVINGGCHSYQKNISSKITKVFYDYESYSNCRWLHKDTDCDCSTNCHQELLEKYGSDQFNIGMDHHVVGIEAAHPGAHIHAHYAEAFLTQIKKQAPKN
jgi:hypothetical protein